MENKYIDISTNLGGKLYELFDEYRDTKNVRSKWKTKDQIVTNVDIHVEKMCEEYLYSFGSNAGFISEEQSEEVSLRNQKLFGKGKCWVLDPIDGSYNYFHGSVFYGVSLGLFDGGKNVCGWLFYPNERRCICSNECNPSIANDNGFTIQRENHSATIKILKGVIYDYGRINEISRYISNNMGKINTLKCLSPLNSVVCEYRRLIHKEIDFSIFILPNIWDHSAGPEILRNTGGFTIDCYGNEYIPNLDNTPEFIIALSEKTHGDYFTPLLKNNMTNN